MIPDVCELRKVNLPPSDIWELAVSGPGPSSAWPVTALERGQREHAGDRRQEKASETRQACQRYRQKLARSHDAAGSGADDGGPAEDRRGHADARRAIVFGRAGQRRRAAGAADVATSETAMGECVARPRS